MDRKRIVQWTDVRAIKLDSTKVGPSHNQRLAGSYEVYVDGDYQREMTGADLQELDPENLFYCNGNRWRGAVVDRLLEPHFQTRVVVCLPKGRIEKFCRIMPKAKHWKAAITEAGERWAKGLTKDQRMALTIHDSYTQSELAALDPKRIDDKELQEAVRLAKIPTAGLIEKRRAFHGAWTPETWANPLAKYPLYDSRPLGGKDRDHIYWYINAAYAARTEEA